MSSGIWQVLIKISLVPNHTSGNLIAYPAHMMVGNTCLQLEQLWMQLSWWNAQRISSVAVERQEHLQSRVNWNIERIDIANSQHLQTLLGGCSAILIALKRKDISLSTVWQQTSLIWKFKVQWVRQPGYKASVSLLTAQLTVVSSSKLNTFYDIFTPTTKFRSIAD